MDLGNTAGQIGEPHLALGQAFVAPSHRIGVGGGHDFVDLTGQPGPRHGWPTRHRDGQLGVHRRQHVRVGDQIGAIHDGCEHPKVNVAIGKYLADFGQALAHGPGIAQPASGEGLADPQRRGHLGGHRLLGVHRPVLGVRAAREPVAEQLPDRGQLCGCRPVLRPRRRADPIQQRRRYRCGRGMTTLKQVIKPGNRLRRGLTPRSLPRTCVRVCHPGPT